MRERKNLNKKRKDNHYNIYIGKNLQEIKKLLTKREIESGFQNPKIIPGGVLQMSNGQIFEVWNEEELFQFATERDYCENDPAPEVWSEESLKEYIQEADFYSKYVFCEYCGSKKEKQSKVCKFCGN